MTETHSQDRTASAGWAPSGATSPEPGSAGARPPLTVQASAALRVAATGAALVTAAPQIKTLADDLASGEPLRLARWIDVDLHDAFDPATLVDAPEHPFERWQAVAGHVNTVLLVLPLLVTWIGLRSASAGYASLIEDDPAAAAQPFFALWQTGFEGTSEPFGAVVAWMLAALVLLIGGQLAARVLAQRIEADTSAVERVAHDQLRHGLLLASCALSERRQGLPAEVDARLRASADALQASADETRRLLAALQRATTKAQKLLDTHLDTLESAPDTLDRAATALSSASTSLAGTTQQMTTAVGEVATQLSSIDAVHRDLGGTLAAALVKHDDAASKRFTVASAEARSAHDELVAALGLALSRVTDTLARDADQSAARFTAAHAQLGSTITALTAALGDAHRIHEVGAAATQSQISALEDMIDRAQGLSDQIAALHDDVDRGTIADPTTPSDLVSAAA